MISNQNEITILEMNVENLKRDVLYFMPPTPTSSASYDGHIKLNFDCLVNASFEFLINRVFCICNGFKDITSNKLICEDQLSNYWTHQSSIENAISPINYSNWGSDVYNYEFNPSIRYTAMNSVYNSQINFTNACEPFPFFGFVQTSYTQNGLVELNESESSGNSDNIKSRKKRNKMSFTMKRITSITNEASYLKKQDEKLSSFVCRADVIYKKILRDFRRYFINDFKEKTGYKDSRPDKLNRDMTQLIENYIDMIFGKGLKFKDEIVQTLGSLIFPHQNFCMPSEKKVKSKKEVNKIHDTLYKFSITKVDRLLEDSSVCFLLKYFVSDQSNKQALIESSKICENSYQTAFDLIEKRINAVLDTN